MRVKTFGQHQMGEMGTKISTVMLCEKEGESNLSLPAAPCFPWNSGDGLLAELGLGSDF